MNLSEIRKKAQVEKAVNDGSPTCPVASGDLVEPTGGEKPSGTKSESPVNGALAEKPHVSPVQPEAPLPDDFDPIAVLMAGRAAASGHDVTAASEGVSPEAEQTEFHELLCFRVAAERYAIDIKEIREIIKPREVTEVPRVPPFVTGVLSLRGIIIPVFDMRMRLGHELAQESGKERIIVVNRGEEFCGVLVDEVTQVASLDEAAIEPPPSVLEGIDRDFVRGIGRINGQMLILLNLEKILDMDLH